MLHGLAIALMICLSPVASAVDATDLGGLVGFTVVAATRVMGDYYGVEPGKPVLMENGMVFSFAKPFSTYTYRSSAVVFAKTEAKTEEKIAGYKLVVGDRLYDATRIK